MLHRSRPARIFLCIATVCLAALAMHARARAAAGTVSAPAGVSASKERAGPADDDDAAVSDADSGPADEHGSDAPSRWAVALLAGYSVLIVLASLAGGWLPSLINLTHTRMQITISFVGGLMLGIGLFHMLPHAVYEMGSLERAVLWMMIGLVTIFFLIRTFHFHQHAAVQLPKEIGQVIVDHGHEHDDHGHEQARPGAGSHRLSWVGIAAGLALHSMMDGLAVAASIRADAEHGGPWSLLGAGTFLAVLLHKPLDAVSVTSLMAAGGWSTGWRNAVNVAFALMCPLGAFLFFGGVERFSEHQNLIVGCGLAFSAGVFLCISLGDLLPEMEFHAHNRVPLSVALLAGIVLAWAIRFLEPEHRHQPHGPSPPAVRHSDEHR